MPDAPNWRQAVRERLPGADESVIEELAQHLESRFEEIGSYDAVLAEWNAQEIGAVARVAQRKSEMPTPGSPTAGIWQDLRYGLRQLRLNPGFAAVAIASLALGIGANTAIFQLLDAVRLRTLPVDRPEQLVTIRLDPPDGRCCDYTARYSQMTEPLWEQVRDHQQAFSQVFAWSVDTVDLADSGPSGNNEARLTNNALIVSGNFFDALGVRPLLGRVFAASDDRPGCAASGAVIGYGFWQREFGGDTSAVGRTIHVNGHPVEVIGVTPASFYGVEVGRAYDLAVPMCADPILNGEEARIGLRDNWWLVVMGRLKPGWSVERADAQLAAISPGALEASADPKWSAEAVRKMRAHKLIAVPSAAGVSDVRTGYEDPLWLLLAIAGMVLLIACANLANLLLARATSREREIAVRLALGASRARLIRQLLLESLLIAVCGAVAGAIVAGVCSRVLATLPSTAANPLFFDLSMDWRVLAFLAAAALVTCVLFGLTPALRATRNDPATALTSHTKFGGRTRFGLRQSLAAAQVAVSLTLAVSALLFVRTLYNLATIDVGFQRSGLLIATVEYDKLKVPETQRLALRAQILERVRAIPGVDSAASAILMPAGGAMWDERVRMDRTAAAPSSRTPALDSPEALVYLNRVGPGFFRTLGVPIVAGRDFTDRDNAGSARVAIVNRSFARALTGDANPIGQRFLANDFHGKEEPFEIVGLVQDSIYGGLREKSLPVAYFAAGQEGRPDTYVQVVIRSGMSINPLLGALREGLRSAAPSAEYKFDVFETQLDESLGRERMMAVLSSSFGVLAMVLAAVGLYGVISFSVSQRTQEIGVRMALGADNRRIAAMILGEAARLLAVGLTLGTALALYVTGFTQKMLYGLTPQDPWSFAIAAGVLTLIAAVAGALPARRAARLDPMAALREE